MKTKLKTLSDPRKTHFKPQPVVAYLNMAQAVRYTGRSYGTLYRHAIEGKLECQQAGSGAKMFFTLGALNKYLATPKQTRAAKK